MKLLEKNATLFGRFNMDNIYPVIGKGFWCQWFIKYGDMYSTNIYTYIYIYVCVSTHLLCSNDPCYCWKKSGSWRSPSLTNHQQMADKKCVPVPGIPTEINKQTRCHFAWVIILSDCRGGRRCSMIYI